jgi:hypothetical protein
MHGATIKISHCTISPFVTGHGAEHNIFVPRIPLAITLSVSPLKFEMYGRKVRLNIAVE